MDDNLPQVFGGESDEESRSNVEAKIAQWKRENPAIAGMGTIELSLLKQMIAAPERYREQQFFLICEFLDRDDAMDHVAAYYEAVDLGMDTGFNVAFMFACAASNEKGNCRSNRVAALLDSMSHLKYTTNQRPEDKKNKSGQERSPLQS